MKKLKLQALTYIFLSYLLFGCGGDDPTPGVPIFTVGGTVTGLSGAVILQLNSLETLTISQDGDFVFPGTLRNKVDYEVTVLHHPQSYSCKIENGEGTIDLQDITDIIITCHFPPAPVITKFESKFKKLTFEWTEADAEHYYQLFENPDGDSGFTLIADNIPDGIYSLPVAVHKIDWPNALYLLQACNTETCSTSSNHLSTVTLDSNAINYMKASTPDAGDQFGSVIALSGDGTTLAIGSPFEASNAMGISTDGTGEDNNDNPASGAVYIFSYDGTDWQQQAYIKASNSVEGAQFGFSVALSNDGNTLAVGAPNQGADELTTYGAAYVFTRSDNVWSEQQILGASDQVPNEAGYRFGASVNLNSNDGNTLVVGAPQNSSTLTWAGTSYVFTRSGSVWSEHSILNASNREAFDLFGHAVKINSTGDTLAISATGEASQSDSDESNNDKPRSGAVYIFKLVANVWQQTSYLKASNPDIGDAFGTALDLNALGDLIAISAPFEASNATGVDGEENNNDAIGSGAVYIFEEVDDMWSQSAYIKASNNDPGDNFGRAIALNANGDELVISAPFEASASLGVNREEGDNTANASGASYFFSYQEDSWIQNTYIKAPNTGESDRFGYSLDVENTGDTLAVGAIGEASDNISGDQIDPQLNNSLFESGAVYLY